MRNFRTIVRLTVETMCVMCGIFACIFVLVNLDVFWPPSLGVLFFVGGLFVLVIGIVLKRDAEARKTLVAWIGGILFSISVIFSFWYLLGAIGYSFEKVGFPLNGLLTILPFMIIPKSLATIGEWLYPKSDKETDQSAKN